ncbi:hypothetical protein VTN77DRAFT_9230 [Rasamsonia byssochlamydoides]|uniref:uncharacterized protein n=1 Tax=Rasamsonia byssochlamydoides TaxID=89139 RepID=UPI00374318F9
MHRQNPSSPKVLAPSPFADFGLSLHTEYHHHRSESDSASASPSSATASPTSSPSSTFHGFYRKHRFSGSNTTEADSRSRSRSPFTVSSLSFRRSPFFLRRRPSAVDLALSEERSRCDEDAIERMGLSMMEPRPVNPIPLSMDLNANVLADISSERTSWVQSQNQRLGPPQPRFVMGGIFEVMEGEA